MYLVFIGVLKLAKRVQVTASILFLINYGRLF